MRNDIYIHLFTINYGADYVIILKYSWKEVWIRFSFINSSDIYSTVLYGLQNVNIFENMTTLTGLIVLVSYTTLLQLEFYICIL